MKNLIIALAALATLGLAACETTGGAGTGSGNIRGTNKPVAFTWQGDDSNSGDMTATFGSGRVFKGEYLQVSHETRAADLESLWSGWDRTRSKSAWRYWGTDSRSDFVRSYNGRVLANLRSENGEYMRCRFTLISPQRGMKGGGEGRCQLSESNREINAEFDRQS